MTIGMDATPLSISSGGLRRYVEQLSAAIAAEFPGDRLHLLHSTGGRWWSVGVQLAMRQLGCDVFHGTNFEVPVLPLKPSVMTIHDISPWMNAPWHDAAGRVRQRTPTLLRLGLPTMIITPTAAVRAQVIDSFRVHGDRVRAIHEAPAAFLRPVSTMPNADRYFLFLATIEPRKNLSVAIDAWREVYRETGVRLKVAGRTRADASRPAEEPGLEVLGEVSDAQLPGLLSGALAVLYPSFYEGFGLPVVEAMQCGAAVITTCDPALLEVSQGAALHVDAADVRGWRAAMRALAGDPALVAERRRLSLRRAADFSWRRTARLTREVYDEALVRFR